MHLNIVLLTLFTYLLVYLPYLQSVATPLYYRVQQFMSILLGALT